MHKICRKLRALTANVWINFDLLAHECAWSRLNAKAFLHKCTRNNASLWWPIPGLQQSHESWNLDCRRCHCTDLLWASSYTGVVTNILPGTEFKGATCPPQLLDREDIISFCPPQHFVIKSNAVVQISWLHYCWKRYPCIKPGNKWEKLT